MLLADLDAPRKQRHTITRIYRRLADEHRQRGRFRQHSVRMGARRVVYFHLDMLRRPG
jgi:hypothetical protein